MDAHLFGVHAPIMKFHGCPCTGIVGGPLGVLLCPRRAELTPNGSPLRQLGVRLCRQTSMDILGRSFVCIWCSLVVSMGVRFEFLVWCPFRVHLFVYFGRPLSSLVSARCPFLSMGVRERPQTLRWYPGASMVVHEPPIGVYERRWVPANVRGRSSTSTGVYLVPMRTWAFRLSVAVIYVYSPPCISRYPGTSTDAHLVSIWCPQMSTNVLRGRRPGVQLSPVVHGHPWTSS